MAVVFVFVSPLLLLQSVVLSTFLPASFTLFSNLH